LRPYEWRPFAIDDTLLGTNSSLDFVIVPAVDLNEMNSPTVMRIRMMMMIRFPGLTPTGVARGVAGVQVRDTADVAPADPFATGDSTDWMAWLPWIVSAESNSASIGAEGLYVDLDNRSMRKIGPRGHDLVLSIGNFGAQDVIVNAIGRVLFKS